MLPGLQGSSLCVCLEFAKGSVVRDPWILAGGNLFVLVPHHLYSCVTASPAGCW